MSNTIEVPVFDAPVVRRPSLPMERENEPEELEDDVFKSNSVVNVVNNRVASQEEQIEVNFIEQDATEEVNTVHAVSKVVKHGELENEFNSVINTKNTSIIGKMITSQKLPITPDPENEEPTDAEQVEKEEPAVFTQVMKHGENVNDFNPVINTTNTSVVGTDAMKKFLNGLNGLDPIFDEIIDIPLVKPDSPVTPDVKPVPMPKPASPVAPKITDEKREVFKRTPTPAKPFLLDKDPVPKKVSNSTTITTIEKHTLKPELKPAPKPVPLVATSSSSSSRSHKSRLTTSTSSLVLSNVSFLATNGERLISPTGGSLVAFLPSHVMVPCLPGSKHILKFQSTQSNGQPHVERSFEQQSVYRYQLKGVHVPITIDVPIPYGSTIFIKDEVDEYGLLNIKFKAYVP